MDTAKQEALWALRAQCGDREALELLLRSVQGSLLRYVRGIVGAADAEDVLQDVLVVVFRKLRWLEFPELFRPWVFRIASRVAFRQLKRAKRRLENDAVVAREVAALSVPSPVELPLDLENMDSVSPASRAVLVLHFQEGLSLPEVSAVLEIPLGTVKSRLAYGLAALRRELSKGGGDV